MISKHVYSFCKEDVSLIENYEQAINDTTQTWDIHHRLEELGLSKAELKEQGLYINRPASELIFLTHSDHMKLHHIGNWRLEESKKKQSATRKEKFNNGCLSHKGEKNPMYGRKGKTPWNKGKKGVQQVWNKGENNPNYGTHPTWMNNGIVRVFPKTQEEIDHYLDLGYDFGYKLK